MNFNTKSYYTKSNTKTASTTTNVSNAVFNKEIQKVLTIFNNSDKTSNINDVFFKQFNYINSLKKQLPSFNYVTELILMTQLVNIIYNYVNIAIDLQTQIKNLEDAITFSAETTDVSNYFVNKKTIVQDIELRLEYVQYLIIFNIEDSNGIFLENNLEIAKEILKNNGNRLKYNF